MKTVTERTLYGLTYQTLTHQCTFELYNKRTKNRRIVFLMFVDKQKLQNSYRAMGQFLSGRQFEKSDFLQNAILKTNIVFKNLYRLGV